MGEENNDDFNEDEDVDVSDDDTQGDSNDQDTDVDTGNGDTDDDDQEGGDDDAGDDADDDTGDGDKDDDQAPPTRNKADHNRQGYDKRVAKKNEQGDGDGDSDDKSNSKLAKLSPEDRQELKDEVMSEIKGEFGDRLDEVEKTNKAGRTGKEVDDFLSDPNNEAFRPFKGKIAKWAGDPSRANIPIESIALEAVGRAGLIKIGAKLNQSANDKAKRSSGGGNSGGKIDSSQKKVAEMTDKEFDDEVTRVKMGGR